MNTRHDTLEQNEEPRGPKLEHQIISRLDRLEKKMDDLGLALVNLARTEERVIRLMESDNEKTKWLRDVQNKVVELEKREGERGAISRRVERGIWAAITAAFAITSALIISWFREIP